MKAKVAPRDQITPEVINITLLHFLALEHCLANTGSIGHGAFLLEYCNRALPRINKPDTPKVSSLYSDRTMRKGNVVIKLTIVAPAPKETKSAGKAQQKIVPVEANKLRKDPPS